MRSFALLAVAAGLAAAPPHPLVAQTPEEQAQLEWVVERGRLIFELDRAAWVGTDDMVERIADPAGAGMRGYIVEPEEGGYAVIFYGGPEEAPVAFYRGRVENHQVVAREIFPADRRPQLTLVQRRMVAVRQVAQELRVRPCEDAPFNTVVIPPETPDAPIDLYLLTPQVHRREWPLGGHYRATIAVDGTVTSSRAFTNSCITLGGGERANDRLEALLITHVLDPLPTEIHVFTMWTSRLPIGVATEAPERMWWIGSEGIASDESTDEDETRQTASDEEIATMS